MKDALMDWFVNVTLALVIAIAMATIAALLWWR